MSVAQDALADLRSVFPESVDKFPLSGPDGMKTPHYGLFTNDGQSVGPTVLQGYVPHTTDDVLAWSEAALIGFGSTDSAEVHGTWRKKAGGEGHYVVICPSREQRRSIYGTEDNIFPRAILSAPYGRAFTASLGMWRDVCQNLSMPTMVSGLTRKIRHTASLRDHLDELIQEMTALAGQFDDVAEQAVALEEQTASIEEFMVRMYPMPDDAPAVQVTRYRNRARKIWDRILAERQQVNRTGMPRNQATLWELVNGITGYVQHDKKRKGHRSNETGIDRALTAMEDPEEVRAWNLAHEFSLAS